MGLLTDAVRARLQEELARRRISQRELGAALGWSQSTVGKLLSGKTRLDFETLEVICLELRLSLVELVRDPGLEFVADLTPAELKILMKLRTYSGEERQALLVLLGLPRAIGPERYAALPANVRKRRGPTVENHAAAPAQQLNRK